MQVHVIKTNTAKLYTMKHKLLFSIVVTLQIFTAIAQPKKPIATKPVQAAVADSIVLPVSKAGLGTFPYFKTLPNFYASDSVTSDVNRAYFYDGKKFFVIDGKTSKQNLTIYNNDEKFASEFECIQAFDKIIATLGGVKIFTGKMPEDKLKVFAGNDIVELGSKGQVAPSAYYGVIEYAIKTPDKEVWVQLVPYSLGSKFYTLLVVEKQTPLIPLNTNKHNQLLADLEKNKKAITYILFGPDNANMLSDSKDELLSIVGIFQSHPDWKLKIECYNAPVGTAAYALALTDKRATAIKQALLDLGVKPTSVEVTGMGDQKPLVPNTTEQGRLTNNRVEITLL